MKLPELQARPQRAERASLATVRPTDLGLGAVARDVAEWEGEVRETAQLQAEVQQGADEEAVRDRLKEFQAGFGDRFATAGAEWDGVSPGFARGIDSAFEAAAEPLLNVDGLTPGQRDALQRGVSRYREAVSQDAIQYQAQRRGALAAEQGRAREAVAVGGVMAGYTTQVAEAFQAIDQNYDGSTGDYATRKLAAHDAAATATIEAAPEHLRPRVTQELASTRLRLLGQAMDVEARAEQAFIANGVKSAGNGLVNAVLTAPSLYETNVGLADQAVAGLPAGQRSEARAGLLNDLTEAYVDGLIRDGRQDAALTQLNSGGLDGRLRPETKARLLDKATRKSEALDAEDWMARLQLSGAIQDDIVSRVTTGVGVGVDVGQVATVLGPREAAEYLLAVEAAEKTHATTQGFGQMTAGAIRAQVEALKPEPGQVDFAAAQTRYEQAARAGEAEIKAREDDPAAWALRQAGSLQGTLAQIGEGDEQASRRAAGAYAVGALTLQETAGVPAAERRILPKGTAASMVAAAEQNPDPAAGLRGLGAVVRAFEPPAGADGRTITAAMARQRMVISELKKAGADNGDIAAALDLGDDPVRLGRYVAADRGGALAAMDAKARDGVEAAVDAALTPYLRSFEGLQRSAELTGGRRLMAQRLAAQRIATRGGSARDAAAEAAEIVAGQYVFVGPSGWRMPAQIAGRSDSQGDRSPHQVLANRGAARIMATLSINDGSGFYAPADRGGGLTETQRRTRYADTIRTGGRWMATPDDGGLALMHRNLDGGWTAALDRGGRPIVRSWASLVDAGRDRPSARGRNGDARVPRGVRNNNPGNIEHRPANRWQGQEGHDGRFARFATPEHGLRALSRDLGTKMERGLTSVRSILTAYAPKSENDTDAYIAAVSRSLGVAPGAALDPSDPRVRAGLMAAIIQHENGQQPYAIPLIQEAARQGMRR